MRDGDRPREEATAPTTIHTELEPPNTTHPAERASRRHGRAAAECHAAASAAARTIRRQGDAPLLVHLLHQAGAKAASAPALRRRQQRRERHATATAPREEPTAPTTTRRAREPPGTTHRAERASPRHGKSVAERHAAASAAARPSRRPSATPPRARRHDQTGARPARAAPQAAAPRAPCDGDRPQRGGDRANIRTQRVRAAEHAPRASHRHGSTMAGRHAAASAAARSSRC